MGLITGGWVGGGGINVGFLRYFKNVISNKHFVILNPFQSPFRLFSFM